MFGIIGSGVLFLISIIISIKLGSLMEKFEFVERWFSWLN